MNKIKGYNPKAISSRPLSPMGGGIDPKANTFCDSVCPKVSVIIPVYNVAPYLKRCLDSLLTQTLQDIEILCIDDCSTDNSLEILNQYAHKDKRVHVICLQTNQGAAVARNKGLEVAKGEYLGFVDPDDAVDLNFYERLYTTAQERNVELVKANRKVYPLKGQPYVSNLNKAIEKNNYYFMSEWQTGLYKHDFILKHHICFPPECPKAQDVVFLARVIYKHPTLAFIDDVYYHYYKRKGSLDDQKIPLKHIISALRAQALILDEVNASSLFDENHNLYMLLYMNVLCGAISHTLFQNDSFEAKKLCAEALIEDFYKCKDTQGLIKDFIWPQMIKFIKDKDVLKLAKHLSSYKQKIKPKYPWYHYIFSIKSNHIKQHFYITILGIKIKIKR